MLNWLVLMLVLMWADTLALVAVEAMRLPRVQMEYIAVEAVNKRAVPIAAESVARFVLELVLYVFLVVADAPDHQPH